MLKEKGEGGRSFQRDRGCGRRGVSHSVRRLFCRRRDLHLGADVHAELEKRHSGTTLPTYLAWSRHFASIPALRRAVVFPQPNVWRYIFQLCCSWARQHTHRIPGPDIWSDAVSSMPTCALVFSATTYTGTHSGTGKLVPHVSDLCCFWFPLCWMPAC